MRRLLLATLLAAGCGDDSAPAPAPAPAPKPAPPRKVSDDTFELTDADNGKSKTIRVGDRVVIELQGAARGGGGQSAFTWEDPVIQGEAVRFVNREDKGPPPHVDGGRDRAIFELRANDSGRAVVRIAKKPAVTEEAPDSKDPKAPAPAKAPEGFVYRLTIVQPD